MSGGVGRSPGSDRARALKVHALVYEPAVVCSRLRILGRRRRNRCRTAVAWEVEAVA